MPTPFLSSEEYDERAHALYNEGQYDEALDLLREGLTLYPTAVELHVGVGYARLAREEFAWARRSFEEALVLDAEHEDALAGLGEVLLKFGQTEAGLRAFERTLELGYDDDVDLMLQIGRALFREGFVDDSLTFFERAVAHAPDSAEAAACVGYAQHRLGHDADAMTSLRRAARRSTPSSARRASISPTCCTTPAISTRRSQEFEKTTPEDHWDELGIWRLIELKKSVYRLKDDDPELKPWEARLVELTGEPTPSTSCWPKSSSVSPEQESEAATQAQGQLETLGGLLSGLAQQQQRRNRRDSTIRVTDVIAPDGAASRHHARRRDVRRHLGGDRAGVA